MPTLDMYGPYALTSAQIDRVVRRISAGNYALGYVNDEDKFIVQYVGRSDGDLCAELKGRLGAKYSRFKFSYAESPRAAFDKECHNFHDFGGSESLDNEIHPARPKGTLWPCPVCSALGNGNVRR